MTWIMDVDNIPEYTTHILTLNTMHVTMSRKGKKFFSLQVTVIIIIIYRN